MRGSYTKQKKKRLFPDAEEVEEIGDGSCHADASALRRPTYGDGGLFLVQNLVKPKPVQGN